MADLKATITLDLKDFESAVNRLITTHLASINTATQKTTTIVDKLGKTINTVADAIKNLKPTALDATLGAIGAAFLDADRRGSELTRTLDELDATGYMDSLTPAAQATHNFTTSVEDAVAGVDNLISSVPVIGPLFSNLITGPAKYANEELVRLRTSMLDVAQVSASPSSIISQLVKLEEDRRQLIQRTSGIKGKTLDVFTAGKSGNDAYYQVAEIDAKRVFLAKQYNDLIQDQAKAQDVIVAGSVKEQTLAKNRLDAESAIVALTQSVTDKAGIISDPGRKIVEAGTNQINKLHSTLDQLADRQFQLNQNNTETATKIAATETDLIYGKQRASGLELSNAAKRIELAKFAGKEEQDNASAAYAQALANVSLAQREVNLFFIAQNAAAQQVNILSRELTGHRELASLMKIEVDYNEKIAAARERGLTDYANTLELQKQLNLLQAQADLDFRTPAQKNADYAANIKTASHNRAEANRQAQAAQDGADNDDALSHFDFLNDPGAGTAAFDESFGNATKQRGPSGKAPIGGSNLYHAYHHAGGSRGSKSTDAQLKSLDVQTINVKSITPSK
jgi:hypothetical protein